MNIFILTYSITSILIGVLAGIYIISYALVYKMDYLFEDISDIIRFIFMWQLATYYTLHERINMVGIIIAEILVTIIFLPANVILFVILVPCLAISLIAECICICFYKIFRKRNEESET